VATAYLLGQAALWWRVTSRILLPGVTDAGKTLNIAGDYIAHGARERASEIASLELEDRAGGVAQP